MEILEDYSKLNTSYSQNQKDRQTSLEIWGSQFYTHHQHLFPKVCNIAVRDFTCTVIEFCCFRWKNCAN